MRDRHPPAPAEHHPSKPSPVALAKGVRDEIKRDNLAIVASGVAFYAFFAIFPALVALVALYGLVADPADIPGHMQQLDGVMPPAVVDILKGQATRLANQSSSSLSWSLVVSLLVTLWSANKGAKALIRSLGIAYDAPEQRGFVKLTALSLALTLGALVTALLAIALVVLTPIVLGFLGLGGAAEALIRWLRWPVLLGLVLLGLAVVYRYAPSERPRAWRWVTPGSALATVLWLLGSAAFSFYLSNFANYNQTFGSLATGAILLMWFYLTAFVILLGAETNAVVEGRKRAHR